MTMTERLEGVWVAFDQDVGNDDAAAIIAAIRQLRHVQTVSVANAKIADADPMASEKEKKIPTLGELQEVLDAHASAIDGIERTLDVLVKALILDRSAQIVSSMQETVRDAPSAPERKKRTANPNDMRGSSRRDGPRRRHRDARIVAEYTAGKSISEIAPKLGLTEATIRNILRAHDVAMRPRTVPPPPSPPSAPVAPPSVADRYAGAPKHFHYGIPCYLETCLSQRGQVGEAE